MLFVSSSTDLPRFVGKGVGDRNPRRIAMFNYLACTLLSLLNRLRKLSCVGSPTCDHLSEIMAEGD